MLKLTSFFVSMALAYFPGEHLSAAEHPDPLGSLCLQSLTASLDVLTKATSEQDRGNQIRYLAWLAMGDSVLTTCPGVWHDQIVALLAKRPAKPKDDLPERWVKLIDGDAVGAVAGLTATSEEARALRAIAEQNPALIDLAKDHSAIAFQAALTAASALSRGSLIPVIRSDERRVDLSLEASAIINGGCTLDMPRAVADWIALSTWVLGKPVEVAPGASNLIKIGAITSALDALRATKNPAAGTHPAYARHVMERGYPLYVMELMAERRECETYAAWLSGPVHDLEAVHPTPVMLARALVGAPRDVVDGYRNQPGDVADAATAQRCATLLSDALADDWGGQHLGWCGALSYLALVAPEVAAPLVKQAAAKWPGGVAAPQVGGLELLAEAAWQSYTTAEVYPLVAAAAKRNPWEYAFAYRERVMNAQLPALRHVANWKPAAEWVQDTVDVAALPFPQAPTPAPESFSITWTGMVEVPTAGTWWFGVESDDDGYLHVGPTLIQNRGAHGMQVHGGEITVAAGPQPLTLEYVQRFMGAGCRLLWHKAGDQPSVIPATALSHGADHAPGLAAAYTRLGDATQLGRLLVPGGDELVAWVAAHPRNLRGPEFLGLMFAYQKCYDDALPLLLMLQGEPTKADKSSVMLVASLLLGTTPRIDEALPLLVKDGMIGQDMYQCWSGLWVIRKAGRQADTLTVLEGNWDKWAPMALIQRAFLEADTGQFDKIDDLQAAVRSKMRMQPFQRGTLLMAEIAFGQLAGKPMPDVAAVHALIDQYEIPRAPALACEVLLGQIDLAAAHTEATALKSNGFVTTAEGMRAMMEGRWDDAHQLLETFGATDPDNSLAWLAKGIALRIAQLPAAEREKIPKLPKVIPPPAPPKENNF